MSKDINALIHCNRFEYHDHVIIVYSQRGEEDIDIEHLISFGEDLLESYGLNWYFLNHAYWISKWIMLLSLEYTEDEKLWKKDLLFYVLWMVTD